MSSLLIHCRRAPYNNTLSRGAVEFAMAAAVFDQTIHLLFSGDGIWQLHKGQDSQGIAAKSHSKLISALPLYAIESILVDEQSLTERALSADDLCVEVHLLSRSDMQHFLADSGQVFNF